MNKKVVICFNDGETARFAVGEENRGKVVKDIYYSRAESWVEIEFEDAVETYAGVPFIVTMTCKESAK